VSKHHVMKAYRGVKVKFYTDHTALDGQMLITGLSILWQRDTGTHC